MEDGWPSRRTLLALDPDSGVGGPTGRTAAERDEVFRALTFLAEPELAVLRGHHDAELHVGHAVALDPVGETPAFIRVEFPWQSPPSLVSEAAGSHDPVAAGPCVADDPEFFLSRSDRVADQWIAGGNSGTAYGMTGSNRG